MKFLKNVKTDEFMATVTRTASKYGYKLKKASPTKKRSASTGM